MACGHAKQQCENNSRIDKEQLSNTPVHELNMQRKNKISQQPIQLKSTILPANVKNIENVIKIVGDKKAPVTKAMEVLSIIL